MTKSIILCHLWIAVLPAFAQRGITLDECKRLALQNNARIQNGSLEMEAAEQTRKAALTRFFPSISAGGAVFGAGKNMMEIETQGGNLPVYDGNPINLLSATQFAYMPPATMGLMKSGTVGAVTATQPLFTGGRIWSAAQLSSLGEEISREKYRLAESEVLLKTEDLYWQVVSLSEKVKTMRRYEVLLENLLSQVSDGYKAGLVSRNDLLKTEVKRSELLLDKSRLEHGREIAVMALCQGIGIPFDSTLVPGDSLRIEGAPQAFRVDHDEALKGRSEYHLLEAMTRAEELQSVLKRGEYLPQVAVGVAGVYMKLDAARDRTLGMVFCTLSIPISGWWEASHALKERGIREQIAVNTKKENSDLLLLQMEKSYRDAVDAYTQVRLSEDALLQADENLKVNQDSYGNGMSPVSDLLEAQAIQQHVNDQLVDARAGYRKALLTYLQVTGR